MTKLLIASLFAASLHAATISHTVLLSQEQQGRGAFSFAGALSVPRFDPALGSLDSVEFILTTGGSVTWGFDRMEASAFPFWTTTATTFLGGVSNVSQTMVLTTQACGGAVVCTPILSGLRDPASCAIEIRGVIVGNVLTLKRQACRDSIPLSTHPATLADYVGQGTVALPIRVELSGRLDGPAPAELVGAQKIDWKLVWNYAYTPR